LPTAVDRGEEYQKQKFDEANEKREQRDKSESPDDDFKLLKDGRLEKIRETGNVDRIFATDEKGNVDENNSIELEKDEQIESAQSGTYRGKDFLSIFFNNNYISDEVFTFLADNSSSEFSQVKFGKGESVISTSLNPKEEAGGIAFINRFISENRANELTEFTHRHPFRFSRLTTLLQREFGFQTNSNWTPGFSGFDPNNTEQFGNGDAKVINQVIISAPNLIIKLYDATSQQTIQN